jgi:hypothetical protein
MTALDIEKALEGLARYGEVAEADGSGAIEDRLALAYRLCCSTAPKQSVGELLDVALKMPEWDAVRAAVKAARQGPQIDYNAMVESMCLTMRHDYGLERAPEDEPQTSGMTSSEREALRRRMAQLVEHCIKPAVERVAGQGEIPTVLFDGYAVYQEVMAVAPNPPRTSTDNVSEVLDAVVRLMRKAGAAGREGGHLKPTKTAETRMDTGFEGGQLGGRERAAGQGGEDARDAARWRFRRDFLANGGAILFGERGCMLWKPGVGAISRGATEEEAIDAAIAAKGGA